MKHDKTKIAMRVVGIICGCIGLFLTILGVILMVQQIKNMDPESFNPYFMWFYGCGVILLVVGFALVMMSFSREVQNYYKNESMPIIKEALKEIREDSNNNNNIKCSSCGTLNSKDSKYCKSCGKQLENTKKCPKCGKEVEKDSTYCSNCGTKL